MLKKKIREKNKDMHEEIIEMGAQGKSKIKHWTAMKEEITSGKSPDYMNRLSQNKCSAIVRARNRMIPVKKKQQNQHQNMTCRLCKDPNTIEQQEHVIEECKTTTDQIPHKIKYDEIFKEQDTKTMKQIAKTIIKIHEIIENNT